jgi:acyl carrier protein
MLIYSLLLIIILFLPIRIYIKRKKFKSKVEEVFGVRESLSKDDFYEIYYKPKKIKKSIVIEILNILENILPIEIGKLNPNDSFVGNLKFLWKNMDDYADIDIVEKIESKFRIIITDEEAMNLKTLEDIILFVADKDIK